MARGGARPGAGRKKGQSGKGGPGRSAGEKSAKMKHKGNSHLVWLEQFQVAIQPYLREDEDVIGLATLAEEARKHAGKAIAGLVRVVTTSPCDRDVVTAARELLDRGFGKAG